MSIVEDRLAALKGRVQLLDSIDWDEFDDQKVDQEFVTEIKSELAKRDLTLDQVADMRRPHIEKRAAELATAFARIRQQHAPGTDNKLFVITNRAQVRLDVIAMDTQTATQFAVRSGHVRAAENATVSQYKDGDVQGLKSSGSALGRAIREGVPGVVEKRGENVIVGQRVFIPMTVVE